MGEYIQGILAVGEYIQGILAVGEYIQGILAVGEYIQGILPTLQDLIESAFARSTRLCAGRFAPA